MKLDSAAFIADRELVEALEKQSTRVICQQDRVLFTQGESPKGLYILKSGGARLSMTSPTGDMIMSIPVSPGSLLGLPALVGNQPYSLTAKALKGGGIL